MKKPLIIINSASLFITIIVNYLSNTGLFNGSTMKTVSDHYHNLFTPAGYAFSIWGLIYAGLIAFVIYSIWLSVKKSEDDCIVSNISWWFFISCTANCFWVIAWLYDFTAVSVLLMIMLLIALLKILGKANREMEETQFKKIAFVWWPFSLYAGWISVALIADIAAYLTKIQWNRWGISEITWTIIMICVAGIINLLMTWVRKMPEFALVGCWALVAVSVANWRGSMAVSATGITVAALLLVSSLLHGFKHAKTIL